MPATIKHRRELLTGAPSSQYAQTLREWYAASKVQMVDQEIAQLEAEAARIEKRMSELKAQVEHFLVEWG